MHAKPHPRTLSINEDIRGGHNVPPPREYDAKKRLVVIGLNVFRIENMKTSVRARSSIVRKESYHVVEPCLMIVKVMTVPSLIVFIN